MTVINNTAAGTGSPSGEIGRYAAVKKVYDTFTKVTPIDYRSIFSRIAPAGSLGGDSFLETFLESPSIKVFLA